MDIEGESTSDKRSGSGPSASRSSASGSRSGSDSRSGSSASNSASRSFTSKSSKYNSRSGSESSRSKSPSQSRSGSESGKSTESSRSKSENSNSRSTSRSVSTSRSRSRSPSEVSNSSTKKEDSNPFVIENVKPDEESSKPIVVEEEKLKTEEESKPIIEEEEKVVEITVEEQQPINNSEETKQEQKEEEQVKQKFEEEEEEEETEEIKVEAKLLEEKPKIENEEKSKSFVKEDVELVVIEEDRKEEEEEVEKPVIEDDIKPIKEETKVIEEAVKAEEEKEEDDEEKEENKPKVKEEEESKLDKSIINKYLDIIKSLRNNYEKDIEGLKMKIKDHTLLDYLTLIIKSNVIYASYTESINTIINKITIVSNEINLYFIDETVKAINKCESEEEVKKSVESVKNHYICLKDCHDLLKQLINKMLKDIDNLKQFNDSKSIENTMTKWNNRNNSEYMSIDNYYEYIYEFMEFLSKIFLSEPPPPPIPNLDYDDFCFKENEFVNVYHYKSKQYRVARIYSILNGIYTVKYLSDTTLKFKANLLYPVLKPQDNVIFHLPADSTPYDGIVVSNMHHNNYWILAKNRRRYYVPIDHLSTDRHYEIGSEVRVFFMDKYSNGVIVSIEYDMRDTYFMIRLYEENEDLLPDRLEKCKTILKTNDN